MSQPDKDRRDCFRFEFFVKGNGTEGRFVSELKEYLEPTWRAPSTSRTKDARYLEWVLLRTPLPDLFAPTAAASAQTKCGTIHPSPRLYVCVPGVRTARWHVSGPYHKAIFPIKTHRNPSSQHQPCFICRVFGVIRWFSCVSVTFAAQKSTRLTTSRSCY